MKQTVTLADIKKRRDNERYGERHWKRQRQICRDTTTNNGTKQPDLTRLRADLVRP